MTGFGHGRRHITTAPVDDFDCHFLFADTHCVNRLGVATPMFAIFFKMAFERGGACWPADAVSFAPVNQTHWSLPDD